MSSRLLDQQHIHGLYKATIDARLDVDRMALMQGIDARFVAILPESPKPSAQLLMDLHGLNIILGDGSVPLRRWLENAHLLATSMTAAKVFETSLEHFRGSDTRLPPMPVVDHGECPFPGLASFDESMSRFFFGRTAEIEDAVARLGDTVQGHRRWLQIEGPSGVGKSSLARAGVVPAIRNGRIAGAPKSWRVAVFRPGTNPIRALAREVRKALEDVGPPSLELVLKQLQDEGSPEALGKLLRKHLPVTEGFLLVIDQLEEAFTLAGPPPRAWLDVLVAEALRCAGSFYLLTTIRSDFVGRFGELPALESQLNDHEKVERYVLRAMSAPGLRASVEGPAMVTGVEWEDGLATRVWKEAAASNGGLPLLAHVLRALWWGGDRRLMSHEAYQALGGVGGALANSADAIVDGLGSEKKERARKLLLRLVKIGRRTEDARQATSRAEALAAAGGDDDAELVLARLSGGVDRAGLEGARLVMVGEGENTGEQRVELVHDALLKEWQTLRRWLDEGRKGLERRDDVETAARTWESAGKHAHALPRGEMLTYLSVAEGVSKSGKQFLAAAAARERRGKAAVVGVIIATVSFLLILIPNAFFSARDQEATKRALIAETNRTNATMAAGAVMSYLRSLADAVRRVAEDERLAQALEEGRTDQLDESLRRTYALYEEPSQGLKTDDRSPFFLWFILDTTGRAKSYSIGKSDPRFDALKLGSYVHRDYFIGASVLASKKLRQTYVSSGFKSTMNDFYQFAISAPVYGRDGAWKGVLVGAVTTTSKLGSLDMDDGQNVAVLAAPHDPTGVTPGIPASSRPDPPEYFILRHPLFKDGESCVLDNDRVRLVGRNSQENEKHLENWWELAGSRWVRSSDDYEDPLGKMHRDAKTGAMVAADPEYQGRRQASFAPVGHTGFVVIFRAKQSGGLHAEWELIWRLVKWAALAAVPGVLLVLGAAIYNRWQKERAPSGP
jgi:hypothetical protein